MLDAKLMFANPENGGFTDAQCLSALTRMNWIAQRWAEKGRRQVVGALNANPARTLPLLLQVAVESGDPIGWIAASWLEKLAEPKIAMLIRNQLPEQTIALRELAATVTALLLETASDEAEKAVFLNNLAIRLSDLGRREEALNAAEKAVRIYRQLAQARPDAFLPDLAMSLNNLANFLSGLGRREEALSAAEEAVRMLRPSFLQLPDAWAHNMLVMCRVYLKACEELEAELDTELLRPIVETLQKLQAEVQPGPL